ncbi:hypothetical protein QBC40DRAFT_19175 [Triangularia verruculosa]|uniref:Protein kinase domain-containing protein n=1 Tax=Triangularia verruculosa TaxID=2587418 RepID=A0AAN7ARA5_9PEZI|nr:hypothetical protein QBC40DRAFT_19175 [Triangularia verruculosa]
MYSNRRDSDKSEESEESEVTGSDAESTTTSLRCHLYKALIPSDSDVATHGFMPRSQLEELLKVDTVGHELLTSGRSVRRRVQMALTFRSRQTQVRMLAARICGSEDSDIFDPATDRVMVFRKILAIILFCGHKNWEERVQSFIDDRISDADLPLLIHTPSKRYELRSKLKPKTRLKCFKSWEIDDRKRFESWQWVVRSPYFGRDKNAPTKIPCYVLPNSTILPVLSSERVGRRGGSGEVKRVEIHSDHHGFQEFAVRAGETTNKKTSKPTGGHFAVKTLYFNQRQRFEKEVGTLKAINKMPHPHLITLLMTYEYREKFHLVFPLAECDLLQYWEAGVKDQSHNDELTCRWFAQQCHGLASGLKQVHQSKRETSAGFAERAQLVRRSVYQIKNQVPEGEDPRPRMLVCQHGDLKPENILLFADPDSTQSLRGKGVLKITDFGEAEFAEDGAMAQKRLPTTPIYQAPEASKALGKRSMGTAYDIWSLGCVYLEFAAWCMGGWAYFDRFVSARAELDPLSARTPVHSTPFFRIKPAEYTGEPVAEVKDSVYKFIDDMHSNPACTRFFHDFLDIIQEGMLVIDPSRRINSVDLERRLDELKSEDRFDPGYFWEHSAR